MEAVGRSLTDAVRKMLRMPNVDERAIKELVKDLQRTLLQADVNVELVLQLSKAVEERSIKEKLPPGINRREHVVKVLYEEMAKFVGQDPAKVEIQPGTFRKIMLVGIQGTGKTTSSVKLARFFSKRGLRVGIVCADTYRPGAYDQLLQLATKAEIPAYGEPGKRKPEGMPKHGLEHFKKEKFIGSGERVEDLELFVPTDFAGRLLGMGDLNALLEKVKEAEVKVPEAKVRQFMEGRFSLKDMFDQMENLRKMGPLRKVLQMIPGAGNLPEEQLGVAEEKMAAWRVIIQSMTPKEVDEPRLVDSSRARRIAHGSGRSEREVRELVNQYFSMRKMMKQMKRRGPMMEGITLMKKKFPKSISRNEASGPRFYALGCSLLFPLPSPTSATPP